KDATKKEVLTMASTSVVPSIVPDPNTGSLMVNVFDGTRQAIAAGLQLLVRVIDGNQKQITADFYTNPSILFQGLPFYNNFGDNYSVVVSADGYIQAGFHPVKISPNSVQHLDLMLLPKNGTFNFDQALWPTLKQTRPQFAALLGNGAADDAAAQARYDDLRNNRPASIASFFNLATAMSAISLPAGTPLDYIKQIIWDDT